jgi:mono/diheme cytochrome c family protein
VKGRMGEMPAFEERLGEQRVRLLAAYVLRMSGSAQ